MTWTTTTTRLLLQLQLLLNYYNHYKYYYHERDQAACYVDARCTGWAKKTGTMFYTPITLSNINQFLKFFHRQNQDTLTVRRCNGE